MITGTKTVVKISQVLTFKMKTIIVVLCVVLAVAKGDNDFDAQSQQYANEFPSNFEQQTVDQADFDVQSQQLVNEFPSNFEQQTPDQGGFDVQPFPITSKLPSNTDQQVDHAKDFGSNSNYLNDDEENQLEDEDENSIGFYDKYGPNGLNNSQPALNQHNGVVSNFEANRPIRTPNNLEYQQESDNNNHVGFVPHHLKNEPQQLKNFDFKSVNRTDDFISMNRLQHAKSLQYYETKLNNFREHYLGRVEGINVQLGMVLASIVQTEEHLNPLELLNDLNKQCVTKYRSPLKTEKNAKNEILACVDTVKRELEPLLSRAFSTKLALENHFAYQFDKQVKNCDGQFDCIKRVTDATNEFLVKNRKTFETQMDAAECTAKANIKEALRCSYTSQVRIISLITEAELLISKCLNKEDVCQPCENGDTCETVEYHSANELNSKTLANPFLKHSNSDCVLLKVH